MKDAVVANIRASVGNYSKWERDFQARDLTGLKDDIGKYKYYIHRNQGTSPKTIDMFARFFLLRKLYSEGNNEEALVEANKLIDQYNLKPVFHHIDKAERDTYLTEETLANATFVYASSARINLAATNNEKFLSINEYLNIRDELLPTISLFKATNTDADILSKAGALFIDIANGSVSVKDEARKSIAAAWISSEDEGDKAFVVIQGKRSTTLQFDIDRAGFPPRPPPPHNRKGMTGPSEDPRRRKNSAHRLELVKSNRDISGDGGFRNLGAEQVLKVAVLEANDGQAAYRNFVERQLAKFSSKDMLLFDVQKDDTGALITVGQPPSIKPASGSKLHNHVQTIRLSSTQLDQLMSGKNTENIDALRRLMPPSDKAAFVAYSNPFVLRGADNRDIVDTFAFQLQRTEKDIRVYRDPLSSKTATNVRELSKRAVGRPTDYIAYIDDGSFNVKDYNIVQDIRKTLTSAGIRIVHGMPKDVKVGEPRNVIVITANSDERMAEFIDALGKSGAFKNNFIILNSCETPITRNVADRITQLFGAQAVFVHQGLIPAANVQDMLVDLSKQIRKQPKTSLVDALRRISHGVSLNGVWVVCENMLQYGREFSNG